MHSMARIHLAATFVQGDAVPCQSECMECSLPGFRAQTESRSVRNDSLEVVDFL